MAFRRNGAKDGFVAIISTAHGYGSGAETVLCELLTGWRAGDGALGVVSPGGSRVADAARGAGIALIPLESSRDAVGANAIAALRTIRALSGAAAVHAWHSRGFELALGLGRILRIPAMGSVHDHPDCSMHSTLRRRLLYASTRQLNGAVFVGDAVAAAWRVPAAASRRVTIRNGLVDHARTVRVAPVLRIGFLGMNTAWKGFDVVSGWVTQSAGKGVQWRLYGQPDEAVQRACAKLRTMPGDFVCFAGRKPTREIFDEIDVLVHASTDFDPYPTVLLEAARAGIPAIASSLGGGAEIVGHGVTGYVFDPLAPQTGFSHLCALLDSPGLRAQLGLAAREKYEAQFTIAGMTRGYANFWATRIAGAHK